MTPNVRDYAPSNARSGAEKVSLYIGLLRVFGRDIKDLLLCLPE